MEDVRSDPWLRREVGRERRWIPGGVHPPVTRTENVDVVAGKGGSF